MTLGFGLRLSTFQSGPTVPGVGQPPAGGVPVLLTVAGQSNARKAGTNGLTPAAKYLSLTNAKILVGGAFQAYDPRTNADADNNGAAWGSEAEFIFQLNQEFPGRPIYVIKEAVNGQSLAQVGGGDWWPDSSGERFSGLEAKIAAARALLNAAGVASYTEVVAWNQGEADANDLTQATNYGANFAYFLQKFRQRISATAFFIAERIRPGLGGDGTYHYGRNFLVRKGTIDAIAADGNGTVVSTDFEPGDFATLHPGASWTEGCGLRAYRAWRGSYASAHGSILDAAPLFGFADQAEVATSTVIASEIVTPTAFERDAAVGITGGEYRILHPAADVDSGSNVAVDWTSSAGRIHRWQSIQVRTVSPAAYSTAKDVEVTIGGVSDIWTVATAAGSVTYEPETDAFAARVSALGGATIAGAQKNALNSFFLAAKGSTWWTKIVSLRSRFGDAVASGVNLKDQITAATQIGTLGPMPWTAAKGWKPNNSNQARDLKINPSQDLPQNDAALILWYSELASGTQAEITVASDTIYARFLSTGAARVKINCSTAINLSGLSTAAGLRVVNRSGASAVQVYGPDASQVGTSTAASVAPVDAALYHLPTAGGGTNSDAALFVTGISRSLTGIEVASLRTALVNLLAAFAP